MDSKPSTRNLLSTSFKSLTVQNPSSPSLQNSANDKRELKLKEIPNDLLAVCDNIVSQFKVAPYNGEEIEVVEYIGTLLELRTWINVRTCLILCMPYKRTVLSLDFHPM